VATQWPTGSQSPGRIPDVSALLTVSHLVWPYVACLAHIFTLLTVLNLKNKIRDKFQLNVWSILKEEEEPN
jgi:hypothetical protein